LLFKYNPLLCGRVEFVGLIQPGQCGLSLGFTGRRTAVLSGNCCPFRRLLLGKSTGLICQLIQFC
jgi:hypothetical protein